MTKSSLASGTAPSLSTLKSETMSGWKLAKCKLVKKLIGIAARVANQAPAVFGAPPGRRNVR
jgi:hypothetical protein